MVVAIGAAALLWLPIPAQAAPTRVTVNDQRLQLRRGDATVQDVLDAAGLQLRVGFMRAVDTGAPVPHRVRQPRAFVNDRRVSLHHRVSNGDRIRLINGKDFTEPVEEHVHTVPASGFPDVEMRLWRRGSEGVVKRVVGRYSGEQAGEDHVVVPAVPAAPVTAPNVMLSFDDGPDGQWTPKVLDILQAKDVKAVFCLVGVRMRKHPDLVRRIHTDGHTLCDHSEHHDLRMNLRGPAYATAEIEEPFDLIRELTGATPRFYRGPGGGLSPWIISEAHRLGMRILAWDVDPGDYRKPGADTIQNRIAMSIRGGGVALLHDGGGDRSQTVEQLPGLIDRLRADGYTIVVEP